MTPSEQTVSAEREDSLNRVLADFLDTIGRGAPVDLPAWQARYPAFAAELADLVAARQEVGAALATETPTGGGPGNDSACAAPFGSLGDFELLEELGHGGMGRVYKARQRGLGRLVALKVIRAGAAATGDDRVRFRTEAEAAARLDHPNIVPVYEVGEHDGQPYLVMRYVEGESLGRQLDRFRDDPRAAAAVVAAVARAVHHAHQRGVLHRDLKPGNVLLERRAGDAGPPVPHITDFGLARLLDHDSGLTRTGDLVGTPSYMAPEQASGGRAVTTATDVHGLGTILYALLTGRPPFAGPTTLETLEQVKGCEPKPPRRLNPKVDLDLETICLTCLAKAPHRRYASAQTLAEDLESWLGHRPIAARPAGIRERLAKWIRRHPARAALFAGVGLGLAVLVGGITWYDRQRRAFDGALLAAAEGQRTILAAEAERERSVREHAYGTAVRRAANLWAAGHAPEAADLLAAYFPPPGREDVRDFAWHYLWYQVSSPHLLWVRGHGAAVGAVTFSPDGRTCASASQDQSIQLWDTASGRRLARWPGLDAHFPSLLRFTPDGRHLVSGAVGEKCAIKIWDTATGQAIAQWPGSGTEWSVTAVSPNGKTIARGGGSINTTDHGAVQLWDTDSGGERIVWRRPHSAVTALCFAPAGDRLAVAYGLSQDGKLVFRIDLFDLPRGEFRADLLETNTVLALAFSPDGATLASGSWDNNIRLWDTATGRERKELPVGRSVRTLAFSPDGSILAAGTGSYSKRINYPWSVTLWDVASGKKLPAELCPSCDILALAYAPDGRTLAVGGTDEFVRLWDPKPFIALPGHQPFEAWDAAFSPDSKTLASAGDDHMVRLWDVATGKQRAVLKGHNSLVTCVAFSPDGKRVAGGGFDKVVRVWDATTGEVLFSVRHEHYVDHVAFSPDGRLLASADRGPTARVWDAATGAAQANLPGHEVAARRLAFAGPRRLVSASRGDVLRLWVADTGQPLWAVQDETMIGALACSPDGKLVATGNEAGQVELWDAATGRPLRVLQGHGTTVMPDGKAIDGIRSVAFSPDGKTLATAGEDKTIRLWQVATGLELVCFKDQPHFVNGLAFSPDGRYLAAALFNGQIRLWEAPREPEAPARK